MWNDMIPMIPDNNTEPHFFSAEEEARISEWLLRRQSVRDASSLKICWVGRFS